MSLPLNLTERANYIDYAINYKIKNTRYLPNTIDYNLIIRYETKNKSETDLLRTRQGLNIPSLTYIETVTQPTATPKPITEPLINTSMFTQFTTQPTTLTPQRGELIPIVDTTTVGLPAGTTSETSFLSKYKMPLIIGGVGIIAYLMFKKK